MKELKFHVGNVTTFLKFNYPYGHPMEYSGSGDGHKGAYGCGRGWANPTDHLDEGLGNGWDYYKVKDRTLVRE